MSHTHKRNDTLDDVEADFRSRRLGTVKWFSEEKGYGFIVEDETEVEHFVYWKELKGQPKGARRTLLEGERVSFVSAVSNKGSRAEDVWQLEE